MRRKAVALFSALLLGLVLLAPVAAEPTSQGLEWTVDAGDVHYFYVDYWEEAGELHEDMYYNVTSNHASLPDPLIDWWDIPEVPFVFYFANGTIANDYALLLAYSWKVTVPIGNWTLMDQLVENVTEFSLIGTYPANASSTTDTWLHWGFSYNATIDIDFELAANVTYLKSDGVLASLDLLVYESGNVSGWIEAHRDGNAPLVESPNDIAYEVGETGHSITWNATDTSPGGYMILKDDVDIQHGFWNSSSEEIVVDVNGLGVGSHNYTVVFYEASGLSTSDTVIVDVSSVTTTTTTPTTTTTTTPTTPTTTDDATTTTTSGVNLPEFLSENVLLLGAAGGIAVILIIVVILRRR
jgi:hypothetical protein